MLGEQGVTSLSDESDAPWLAGYSSTLSSNDEAR